MLADATSGSVGCWSSRSSGTPTCCSRLPPHGLGPAIDAGDPSRSARIDPAVERFVPLAQLLPFEPGEAALGLHSDQLLADKLLHPFGFGTARQVDIACREFGAGSDLLVRRRRQCPRHCWVTSAMKV